MIFWSELAIIKIEHSLLSWSYKAHLSLKQGFNMSSLNKDPIEIKGQESVFFIVSQQKLGYYSNIIFSKMR